MSHATEEPARARPAFGHIQKNDTYTVLPRLSEEQYRRIAHLLPRQRGNTRLDARRVLEAVVYVQCTGIAWNVLPASFGPWQTVYARARRWARQGVLQSVMAEIAEPAGHAPMERLGGALDGEERASGMPRIVGRKRMKALADNLRPLIFGLAHHLKFERSDCGISQLQVAVMMNIEEWPGTGLERLATRLEVHPSTIGSAIRDIAERGWLRPQARDPRDKRRAWLELSESGHRVIGQVRAERSDQLVRQFLKLSPEQFLRLEQATFVLQAIQSGLSRALFHS
ncbi:MAG: transposase [Pseudoxanthomonas sp.]